MKKTIYALGLPLLLMACGGNGNGEGNMNEEDSVMTEVAINDNEVEEEAPKPPKSPRKKAEGTVDGVGVKVDYGSPYVKERVIYGELVPYDKIWRAGANETTAITFENDVVVGDEDVAAGTYAFFIIPQENPNNWTVVINEEWSKEEHGVWGAYDHKPEKDIVRVEVTPEFGDETVESLTYKVENDGVVFMWEKASFKLPVSAK